MSSYSFFYKSYRIPFVANKIVGVYLPTVTLPSSKLRRLNLFNQPFMSVPGDELVRTDDIFNNYTVQIYADQTQCASDELMASTNDLPEVTNNKYTAPFLKSQGDNVVYVGKCPSNIEILEVQQDLQLNQDLFRDQIAEIINNANTAHIARVDADTGFKSFLEGYNPQPNTEIDEFKLLYKVIYDYRFAMEAYTTWSQMFPVEVKQFLEDLRKDNESQFKNLVIDNDAVMTDINTFINKMNTKLEEIKLIPGITARPLQADLPRPTANEMEIDTMDLFQGTNTTGQDTFLDQNLGFIELN
ncbi:hypothetical protein PmNV_077 [Penaeus monodon nudivirus]|uniref:Uncharacterized protein n=1 Tax=Penaeus monodon nudivirus TaxID=1529056 RepID=A0A076FE09_9VIRU|nr:hypothetical protein PmNV_077 [Penaeus monodon nudivirus]AII15865.1 hypothetical protein PmNV_077 [Penaeus monodon nudivirus]